MVKGKEELRQECIQRLRSLRNVFLLDPTDLNAIGFRIAFLDALIAFRSLVLTEEDLSPLQFIELQQGCYDNLLEVVALKTVENNLMRT